MYCLLNFKCLFSDNTPWCLVQAVVLSNGIHPKGTAMYEIKHHEFRGSCSHCFPNLLSITHPLTSLKNTHFSVNEELFYSAIYKALYK